MDFLSSSWLTWGHPPEASINSCRDAGSPYPLKKEGRKEKKKGEKRSATWPGHYRLAQGHKMPLGNWVKLGWLKQIGKELHLHLLRQKVNPSYWIWRFCLDRKNAFPPISVTLLMYEAKDKKKRFICRVWVVQLAFLKFPLAGQTRVAQRGNKGKHSHRNHCLTVTVSASARKWIHVICPLPEGTEVLMAGLSILVAAFYPISGLSQAIQLLLLIAFFHFCLRIAGAGFVSERAGCSPLCLPLVPRVPDPHLPLLPVCVNKRWGGDTVCLEVKGKVAFSSWFCKPPQESGGLCLALWGRLELFFFATISQGFADNYRDSTHACISRRSM